MSEEYFIKIGKTVYYNLDDFDVIKPFSVPVKVVDQTDDFFVAEDEENNRYFIDEYTVDLFSEKPKYEIRKVSGR